MSRNYFLSCDCCHKLSEGCRDEDVLILTLHKKASFKQFVRDGWEPMGAMLNGRYVPGGVLVFLEEHADCKLTVYDVEDVIYAEV